MSLDRRGYTTGMDKMFPIKKNTMWVWEEDDILKGRQKFPIKNVMWVWIGEEILKNDKIFPISDIHNVRLNRRGYTYFRHGQNISYLDKHIVGWLDGRGCTIDITKYFLFK